MMRHQYWVTKKTVLKKLGTKEDECIVASDAELDAKLELFRSISDSCLQLQRVLDLYQERLCVLSQEENALGKFLSNAGKSSDASAIHMVSAGKAISYSGQQRLAIRGPLLRLYHEVETFRGRAVSDMRATVSAMEKARIEYRAALSWMKSASSELDPDTGRGLDNFRKAQRQVRESKKVFDKLTLDVLQKIDLLAAARCNMFSHVLSNYQNSFLTFSSKVAQTLEATADSLREKPQYEFCVLKELSENLGAGETNHNVDPQDKDQMLFFKEEYKDDADNKPTQKSTDNETQGPSSETTIEGPTSSLTLVDTSPMQDSDEATLSSDLAGLQLGCGDIPATFGSFMPSALLQDLNMSSMDPLAPLNFKPLLGNEELGHSSNCKEMQATSTNNGLNNQKPLPKKDDKAAWFKLFAELDPLANPDSLPGSNTNQSHAA